MGSHGASNLFESLLGSVSHTVASESQCPVILVPPGVEFYKLSHVCILGNRLGRDISQEVHKVFPTSMSPASKTSLLYWPAAMTTSTHG